MCVGQERGVAIAVPNLYQSGSGQDLNGYKKGQGYPHLFYDGPQGYAYEPMIEEVIGLLSFPEEFEPNDMAIEDLLTTRERR
jgi:hypothetical protein